MATKSAYVLWPKVDDETLERLWRAGKTPTQIAPCLTVKRSPNSVKLHVAYLGLVRGDGPNKDRASWFYPKKIEDGKREAPAVILNAAQQGEVVRLHKSGVRLTQLGTMFRVPYSQIEQIIQGGV